MINSIMGSIAILLIAKYIDRNRMLEFFSKESLPFYAFQNKLVIPAGNKIAHSLLNIAGVNRVNWLVTLIFSVIGLSIVSVVIEKKVPWLVRMKEES